MPGQQNLPKGVQHYNSLSAICYWVTTSEGALYLDCVEGFMIVRKGCFSTENPVTLGDIHIFIYQLRKETKQNQTFSNITNSARSDPCPALK